MLWSPREATKAVGDEVSDLLDKHMDVAFDSADEAMEKIQRGILIGMVATAACALMSVTAIAAMELVTMEEAQDAEFALTLCGVFASYQKGSRPSLNELITRARHELATRRRQPMQ